MTLDDFRLATELLFAAHTPYKASDKLRAFYHFFKLADPSDVRVAAEHLARTSSRFPSISEFGDQLSIVRRNKANGHVKVDCKFCDGIGLLSTVDSRDGLSYSYRCNCLAASRHQKVPSWFGSFHPDRVLAKFKDSHIVDDCPW